MKCSENWKQSSFVLRMRESQSESVKGGRRWMTQADIVNKYTPGRSPEDARDIAAEIVAGKESCPHMKVHHIRPHPNCPTRQDMRLFLVWDEEYETTSKDTVVESLFQCDDVDQGTNKSKTDKNKGKSRKKHASSSSSSVSSDPSSSQSSSSSHRDRKKKDKKKGKKGAKPGSKSKNGSKSGKTKPLKVSDESADEADGDNKVAPPEPTKLPSKAEERKARKEAEKKRKQEEREVEKEKKRIKTEEKKQETKEKNQKRNAVKKANKTIYTHVIVAIVYL